MKYVITTFGLILLMLCSFSSAAVTVLEDNSSRFVCQAVWKGFTTETVNDANGNWFNVAVDGLNYSKNIAGAPNLPAYKFAIGVPPEGIASIKWAFSGMASMLTSYPVKPFPKIVNGLPISFMDTASYLSWRHGALVDTATTIIGNQRVLEIVVSPFAYDYKSSSLGFYENVSVSINFTSGGARAQSRGHEGILAATLLNYNTATSFRILPQVPRSLAKSSALAIQYEAERTYKIVLRNTTPFGNEAEGMYSITGADLKGVAQFSAALINDIRLYAPVNLFLRQLYKTGAEDSLALRQVPIEIIDKNGNGFLDDADEIRFFGRGDTRFVIDGTGRIVFERNPFDDRAVYWLAVNSHESGTSLRIMNIDSSTIPIRKDVTKGLFVVHRERDLYNPSINADKDAEHFALGMVWQDIGGINCFDKIDGLLDIPDSSISIYCPVNPLGALSVVWNGDTARSTGNGYYRLAPFRDTAVHNATIQYVAGRRIYLDYYQVHYNKRLSVSSSQSFYFGLSGADTLFNYKVALKTSDSVAVFDISNGLVPARVYTKKIGDSLLFSARGRSAGIQHGHRFAFVPLNGGAWLKPSEIELADNSSGQSLLVRSLRSSNSKDYVIVVHPQFIEEAIRLATHRKEFAADSVNNPAVVRIDDVYDQFSGGVVDPAALRNFLVYAQKNWGNSMALLFGAGYRTYRTSAYSTLVPTYIPFNSTESSRYPFLSGGYGTCTDDFFMNANGWKVKVGRFPVATFLDAKSVVDKTIAFDLANEEQKGWRNRAVLSADDDMQLSVRDPIITGASYHHMSGTEACDTAMPESMERAKVYMQRYEADPVTREKPAAKFALLEAVNRGALLWYYIGHGAAATLASENLFTVDESIKKLTNSGRNGLFWAASCNVGKFDDPTVDGLCVKLLTVPLVGSVASVGASRESNAGFSANDGLMLQFTRALFRIGGILNLGDALQTAKINQGGTNSQHYNLLGDPALRLYPIAGSVTIDHGALPDTLSVLSRYTVTGNVAGMSKGEIVFRVAEPQTIERVPYGTFSGGQTSMNIRVPGRTISSGASDVNSGKYSLSLLVPKDAPVGVQGIRLLGFSSSAGRVAATVVDSLDISAYEGSGLIRGDGMAPRISFYLSSGTPLSGSAIKDAVPFSGTAKVNRSSIVTVVLQDPDGIRLNGVGPNEALYYEIVGKSDRKYVEALKDVDGLPNAFYFSVYITDLMSRISGSSRLKVSAMDNFDNAGSSEIALETVSDSSLGFNREQVFPYPNPFSGKCRIIWQTVLPADVIIKIYTQSGKLVKTLKSRGVKGAFDAGAESEWNGLDEKGNKMARGIYFYTIKVSGSVSANTSSMNDEASVHGVLLKD